MLQLVDPSFNGIIMTKHSLPTVCTRCNLIKIDRGIHSDIEHTIHTPKKRKKEKKKKNREWSLVECAKVATMNPPNIQ